MNLRRVVRGVLSTAAAWGIAWVPLTAITWGVAALLGRHVPPLDEWRPILVSAMVRGAINGAAFAIALAIAGRRWRFSSLRTRQMVLWGAVGGLVAPTISLGVIALMSPVSLPLLTVGLGMGFSGALGAVTAASALWVARRAPELHEREPLSLEQDSSVGLTRVINGVRPH